MKASGSHSGAKPQGGGWEPGPPGSMGQRAEQGPATIDTQWEGLGPGGTRWALDLSRPHRGLCQSGGECADGRTQGLKGGLDLEDFWASVSSFEKWGHSFIIRQEVTKHLPGIVSFPHPPPPLHQPPDTHQARPHRRASALAVPSAWMLGPPPRYPCEKSSHSFPSSVALGKKLHISHLPFSRL